LICNLIEADGDVAAEKRVFAAQFVEGETARLVMPKTALVA